MDLHRNASISLKPLNVTNSNSSNISINFTLASSFEVTDRNGNVGRLIPFKLKSDTNRIVNINKNITVLNPFKPSNININAMMILYVIPNIEFCAHLNHGWEASLEICPYIQFRFINWSWKCVKVMYTHCYSYIAIHNYVAKDNTIFLKTLYLAKTLPMFDKHIYVAK